MDSLAFMAAVLPYKGPYCAVELSTKRKEHVYADDIEALGDAVKRFNDKEYDTFFALASFKEPGSREATNAKSMRSIFLDIDCGGAKQYKTKSEAGAALMQFIDDSGLAELGMPWINSSGNGIHAYWAFHEDIDITTWKPVAENFKRVCRDFKLHIDMAVPADAARILRVPGTKNWKDRSAPRPAKTLQESNGPFDFGDFASIVLRHVKVERTPAPTRAPAPVELAGQRPSSKQPDNTRAALLGNTDMKFKRVLDKTSAGNGCAQLQHYIENAADDGMEPLWMSMLSIAKFCSDSERAARWLSQLHPYAEDRMQDRLSRISGTQHCVTIDNANPGVCDGCAHFGKLKTPISLAMEVMTDTSEKEIVIPSVADPRKQVVVKRPEAPRGFTYGEKGGVYRLVRERDADGAEFTVNRMVLPYDMFVVDILHERNDHTVHMLAMRPEGVANLMLPLKAVVSKDETAKILASQNIVASFGAGNDKNLHDYVRACAENASSNKRPVKVPAHYGWQDDDTFVFNNRIYSPKGETLVPMPALENLNLYCATKGSLEEWRKIMEMFIRRDLDDIVTWTSVNFGAPLMRFTGFNGLTIHLGSTESGTGKSMCLEMAASIWGHPTHYRVSKKTSDVAMQQRAGDLHSMALISDEITDKNRNQMEWFPAFVFDYSEGKGKDRMEAGANKERVNLSVWSAIALLSSNTHMVDYMVSGRSHSSEGELRRMLERTMSEVLHWDHAEVEIIAKMGNNYGVAGHKYAQWLVRNVETARTMVRAVQQRLMTEFGATSDERYWIAGCAAIVAGAIMVGSNYADVIDLPIERIIAHLKNVVLNMRSIVKSSARSSEDILNSFIREYYGKFVIVRDIDGERSTLINERLIDETITRAEVFGRVEEGVVPGFTLFHIEEHVMRKFCASSSFGYTDWKRQIGNQYVVDYMKKDMLAKTKGPAMRVNAIRIRMPNEVADEFKAST